MKILVANPNRSQDLTSLLMESARLKVTDPNTELIPMSNPIGSTHIDCTFGDYQSVWSFIRAVLKKVEEIRPDAVVIAGFGNFGMFALKEALDIPVLAIAETSQMIACMLGHQYSILTVLKQNIPYQEDLVHLLRLQDKCASVRGVNVNLSKCASEEETYQLLKKEIETIVEEDGADVVVLGGARFCCYANRLSEEVGIPVLDPVAVTVKMAEMMVETGLCQSKKCKFAFPPQPIQDYFWSGEN